MTSNGRRALLLWVLLLVAGGGFFAYFSATPESPQLPWGEVLALADRDAIEHVELTDLDRERQFGELHLRGGARDHTIQPRSRFRELAARGVPVGGRPHAGWMEAAPALVTGLVVVAVLGFTLLRRLRRKRTAEAMAGGGPEAGARRGP